MSNKAENPPVDEIVVMQPGPDGVRRPTAVRDTWWHCRWCGDHEHAEEPYALGDKEPCIACGQGVCEVMTLTQGAKWESEIARGLRQPESAYSD